MRYVSLACLAVVLVSCGPADPDFRIQAAAPAGQRVRSSPPPGGFDDGAFVDNETFYVEEEDPWYEDNYEEEAPWGNDGGDDGWEDDGWEDDAWEAEDDVWEDDAWEDDFDDFDDWDDDAAWEDDWEDDFDDFDDAWY